ncbi:hypothetical protein ruthe_01308 [Rubellimicrobium thermophilum DSM 16684]|uniref:Uncharacterized protein n=1 Tax=Rubellimicrobium thermophilum DSM 16684 TaxID=1123069 RepID=S9R3D3_9RHOB|nr:hypothetical protein [Rubellimicrobium thermophilum]EPX86493.1 hypothetical protein ruthe_01308 [Rubellimicrobium thermophilum DSM 16684]
MAVAQGGRLEAEALLLAASLREAAPGFAGRLILAEPQPGPLWPADPRLSEDGRSALQALGAEIRPFDSRHFGAAYPYGNKIEGLAVLPAGEPFLFLDTDTLILGDIGAVPFDFDRPTASMRREGTWPVEQPYWPGYAGVWGSLYARFGLDMEATLDRSQPEEYWERFLYFNAGWFTGPDPAAFGERFLRFALAIREEPGDALACQSLDPWLDQVALPLVVASFGGGRPGPELAGMDGDVTCHYRSFPLLYARESDAAVAMLERLARREPLAGLLRRHEPLRRMAQEGEGARVRALFDRRRLPRREKDIRQRLKAAGYWLR